ncbi:MAG: hypothetical protein ABR563_17840 [Pyrinomonadaceae bacterium]
MFRLKKILCATALFVSVPVITLGQDISLLSRAVVNSIRIKAPAWKLETQDCLNTKTMWNCELEQQQKQSPMDMTFQHWTSGELFASFFMVVQKSPVEVGKTYEKLKTQGGAPFDKRIVLDAKAEQFGDESFVWSRPGYDRHTGITLRKGCVVVDIDASSFEIAKQFASYVADVLPTK